MIDAQDFQSLIPDPVRDEVGRSRDDQFPGSGHPPGSPERRVVGQGGGLFLEPRPQRLGSGGVIRNEVRNQVSKIAARLGRPDDFHERPSVGDVGFAISASISAMMSS